MNIYIPLYYMYASMWNKLPNRMSIKWKHFPRYWPSVRGIHRSPVNSPHKGQWRGDSMFSLIFAWTNGWVNNRDAGDLRCHRAHYDVTVTIMMGSKSAKGLNKGHLRFKLTRTQSTTRLTSLIARFMRQTWGPPGSCRPQMGPMLAPWTLLSRMHTEGY